MPFVAIICEYNPFHNGHEYQIKKIREEFGKDTTIIAIMSGNYTQRGETAILDKLTRAECAVECGANLVLELPFPYSVSSAELFAGAAVHIADSLGVIDYLSFGSECGSIEELTSYAENCLSKEYSELLSKNIASDELSSLGYAKICEATYKELYGENTVAQRPNNILALEYIKALIKSGSNIKPHTIKRVGADFDEESITEGSIQSASAIRQSVLSGDISALEHIPNAAKPIILNSIAGGQFPCDMERLAVAVISNLRLNPADASCNIHDVSGGLYNRLRSASFKANTIKELVSLTETKKYTNARIYRAIWYSYLGVTSSDVKKAPEYTQLLAMDKQGRACLKEIGKRSSIPVLTKPSRLSVLSDKGRRQKALSDRADSVFQLTKPEPPSGNFSLTFTPFVKK